MARRLRAQGRVRVLSGRDLGAEAVTETPSSDLDRSALTGHVRLRGQAPVQHPLLALTRPMSEVELYKKHMERALADNPGKPRPIFATMRHTVVYERKENWEVPVKAARCASSASSRTCSRTSVTSPTAFPGRGHREAPGLRRARRRPLHLLREPGPRHEGAEAVHGVVRQGSDAGVRLTKCNAGHAGTLGQHVPRM